MAFGLDLDKPAAPAVSVAPTLTYRTTTGTDVRVDEQAPGTAPRTRPRPSAVAARAHRPRRRRRLTHPHDRRPAAVTAAAIAHLAVVVQHWPDLDDALSTRQNASWPPAMGIARVIDAEDMHERAADDAPGARPVPLNTTVFDTMREIETALVGLTDALAATIQRPAYTARPSAGPLDELGRQMRMYAVTDQADERRWHWTGTERTAPDAARWLTARLESRPGPFRALLAREHDDIAAVAAAAAQRVERALGVARLAHTVPHPCPHCRGQLTVEGGDGQDPAVKCRDCGRTWRTQVLA